MANIVVIGSTNTDLIIKSERLPKPGETIGGGVFQKASGGKGANQAVSAAYLGGQVTFISSTGDDDLGKEHLEHFKKAKINTQFIFEQKGVSTGVAIITVDQKGENTIVVAPGANHSLTPDHIDQAAREFEKAEWILLQLEIPMETVNYAIQKACNTGKKVMLNTAPAQVIPDNVLKMVHTLVLNETEAEVLTGQQVTNKEEIRSAANKLLAKGPENIILTLGAEGVYFLNRQEEQFIGGFQVDVVDTTAAGDVFCGGLAVALGENQGLMDAVKFASAAAALSVGKMGAQPSVPKREEVMAFLTQ